VALEPLDAEAIARHTRAFELEIHEQLDSTQERARQRLMQGHTGPAAVIADAQSAGRGQHGRSWLSPSGAAVYLTAIWPTARTAAQLAGLSLAVGLVIRRMLAHWQIDARLKWPNDVWLDQRKLAGVLIDVITQGHGARLLIGIGLNLRLPQEAAQNLDQPWTELSQWLSPLPSRNLLIGRLLHELQGILTGFEAAGFTAFSDEWRGADGLCGQQIWWRGSRGAEQGQALGVDELGRLRVDIGGKLRLLTAGEVSVRPF
jgi:BirA family transcriptional regulator, biotin operon repressor / biotin---[acetyl-CoA-carboxylase] ligase